MILLILVAIPALLLLWLCLIILWPLPRNPFSVCPCLRGSMTGVEMIERAGASVRAKLKIESLNRRVHADCSSFPPLPPVK